MKRYQYDNEVSNLKAEGLGVSEIARRLNISRHTIYDIVKRLDRGDGYPDKLKKIKELRKQGKNYQEIADELGLGRDYIEHFCQRNDLKYSEKELKQRQVEEGTKKSKHLVDFQKKPLTDEDWSQRVDKRYGGSYELVSVGDALQNHERMLVIRCRECGDEKIVSTITVRHPSVGRCLKCHPQKHREPSKTLAVQKELIKQKNKIERERKQIRRKLKSNQIMFSVCECGALLPPRRKACDECKRKTARAAEQRKETARRLRTFEDFDSEVTLEWTIKAYNNVCYLCGRTCNKNDYQVINGNFVVGMTYPTMEHIIPICKGGKHTKQNVKLACFGCNTKKGRKLLAS